MLVTHKALFLGGSHQMADVWFAQQAENGSAPVIGELLTEPAADLVGSTSVAANTTAAATVASTPAAPTTQLTSIDEELMRNQTPLI